MNLTRRGLLKGLASLPVLGLLGKREAVEETQSYRWGEFRAPILTPAETGAQTVITQGATWNRITYPRVSAYSLGTTAEEQMLDVSLPTIIADFRLLRDETGIFRTARNRYSGADNYEPEDEDDWEEDDEEV